MARQVYRKSLLERISSPDQLDKMIVITSPSFWLAILGGAIIVAVVLVWSIFGRLPMHMETTGVFLSEQATVYQTVETGGRIASIEVAAGDTVAQGDLLAVLQNETAERSMQELQARRAEVAAVTLDSKQDVSTADTLELINLKLQYQHTGQKLYGNQFEVLRAAMLDSLDDEINAYVQILEKTQVRAQAAGVVAEILAGEGAVISQGSAVVSLRQAIGEQQVICYVPVSLGKTVAPGMEVVVCPTTVNQQIYGNMMGEVVAVDEYVTSYSTMQSALGSDALAQMFAQQGPVVGVTCKLRTDDSTASGFWWSNKKGGTLELAEGTIVMADIITEEKAPITMLVPYVKDKVNTTMAPGTVTE
ncbi:MAG: hypothetical protein II239_07085 [Peptococcaceae bacterium]|nr:hypothetical protein [Peptococcaceae bacterium]